MSGSRLLVGVAAVLAGTAVLFVVLGAVFNPILVLAALPFGLATTILWAHLTGRLGRPVRRRARPGTRRRAAGPHGRRSRTRRPDPRDGPTRSEAARVLGVDADADQVAIRRAYRERVKRVHPDADGGSEAAFVRVRESYERLRED